MRHLIGGVVEIKGIANRCGDVRVVEVSLTSGDRFLDESALKAAKHWRLPPAILSGKSGEFSATLVFTPAAVAEDWFDSKTRVDSIWKSRSP
jgi:TonB family protein